MRGTMAVVLFSMGMVLAVPKDPIEKHVVLPNPRLVRHCSSICTHFWDGDSWGTNDIYPLQLAIDIAGHGCPRGVVALYDNSVSLADIKGALDQRYEKWANPENSRLRVKIWRVEPENVAVQLAEIESENDLPISSGTSTTSDDGRNPKKGLKQLIYLPLDRSKCDCQ